MQSLAPDFFCPLTNRQPYQRDKGERRRPRARVENMEDIVATLRVETRRVASRSRKLSEFAYVRGVELGVHWGVS